MSSGDPRHLLLGLVVLFVTMSSGYMVSRATGVYESVTGAYDSPSAGYESAPTSTPVNFYIRTDFHIRVESDIRELATRYRLSEDLVAAVIEAESHFDPGAVSCRGARGLMQLMPATAATLGVDNPFDRRENIEAGIKHLRAMMDIFKNNVPLALAAYNAGERAVIRHRGIPPYRETRQYVNRILRRIRHDGGTTSPIVNAAPRGFLAGDDSAGRHHRCS
jgi:soluble lytic murein transglycosylase-like protein